MADEKTTQIVAGADTTVPPDATNDRLTTSTTVDGVDLSTLTAEQLLALSEEEWGEFEKTVEAAIAAKKAEAQAAFKEKITKATTLVKTYALPVLKYAAGAYVVAKIAGVI